MKFGVIVFPGSNCDMDCYYAAEQVSGEVSYVWHQERDVSSYDCLILPGGFSYGDYLRTGAIARFSPVMEAVVKFAQEGGLVVGICNGFQILLEVGLLPGAMLTNQKLKFLCQDVYLRVENNETPFTQLCQPGEVLKMPIAHHAGNYFASPEDLNQIKANGQIILRYCDQKGEVAEEANPNGSVDNIAGIANENKNVFGMMPHPERAIEPLLGSSDGRLIFQSIVNAVKFVESG